MTTPRTLTDALRLARMVLEQGGSLSTRIAAGNGPTLGEVIDRALAHPDVTGVFNETLNLRYCLMQAVLHFARKVDTPEDVALLAQMRDQLTRDPILHESAAIAVRAALVRLAGGEGSAIVEEVRAELERKGFR